jgi:hypothetical protein
MPETMRIESIRMLTEMENEEFQALRDDYTIRSAEREDAIADYFEVWMREVLSEAVTQSLPPEEEFLGPYTLDEFCALPEDEQVRLWDQAHAQAWEELSDVEYPLMIS